MKKLTILLVIDGRVRRAGIQTLMLDICQRIDKEKFQIIWYFTGDLEELDFYKEVIAQSKEIYYRKHVRKTRVGRYIQMLRDIKQILNVYHIDILHMNSGLHITHGIVLLYGKLFKINKRISHAHGVNMKYKKNTLSVKEKLECQILKKLIVSNANILIACSKETGEIVFGSKTRYHILKNGIDLDSFMYSEKLRTKSREDFNLTDKFVVGTIARFSKVKNYPFLINSFEMVLKNKENAMLLLVGDGEEKEEILAMVKQKGIEKNVIFVGHTNEVTKYLHIMDVFVLPSFTEGLSLVTVEAQVSGLPCVVSTGLPDEILLTDKIQKYPLSDGFSKWANYILESKKYTVRKNNIEVIRKQGFDIEDTVQSLEELYLVK
jgi:glycosyltransferase involved in cell wall biosynthesis